MFWSRSRSFPSLALAALLLLLALTLSFAQGKRDEKADQKGPPEARQAPPGHQGQGQRSEPARPGTPPAPQPQMVPPGRQQQGPSWQQPAPQGNQGWRQPAPQGRGWQQAEPSQSWRQAPRGEQTWRQRTPEPNQTWRQPAPQEDRGWRQRTPEPNQTWRQPAPQGDQSWRQAPERGRTDRPNPYVRTQPREEQAPPADRGWRNRGDQPEQPRPRYSTPETPRANGRGAGVPWYQRDQQPAPQDRTEPRGRGRFERTTPQPQAPPQGEGPRGQNRWTNPRGNERVGAPDRRTPNPEVRAPGRGGRPQLPDRPQPPAANHNERPVTPRGQAQQQLRMRVPEAKFRGPEADKRVISIPERDRAQMPQRFRQNVQDWNRQRPNIPQNGRLQRDVIGHPVPRDARFIDRSHVTRINLSYTRVEHRLGPANNYYTFIPRYPGDYWQGYWDGYRDGSWDGRRHRPHSAVVINFYYGYYWSDPDWFGFYYPGYYTSVYHYYGYCPGWVYPSRVYVYPTDYVYWPTDPYRYYSGARVDERGAEDAIRDIRKAWLDSDVDRFSQHLTDELDVQVYFDGEYQYTTSTEDYYGMTADALASTQTASLDFDDPIFISSHEVFYTGRHVFYDPDGYRQTVYVSYRLRKLGGEWYIVAVGSSLEPIQHKYTDFRYN